MDVMTFNTKVVDLLEKNELCDENSIPKDLSVVVATCFLDTGVSTFDHDAVNCWNMLNKVPFNKKPLTSTDTYEEKICESGGREYVAP